MTKILRSVVLAACSAVFLLPMAFADNVKVDYNHQVNFSEYHTYSWGKIKVSDPLLSARIQRAVDTVLQKEGWQEVTSGGQITIMAHDNVHNEQGTIKRFLHRFYTDLV